MRLLSSCHASQMRVCVDAALRQQAGAAFAATAWKEDPPSWSFHKEHQSDSQRDVRLVANQQMGCQQPPSWHRWCPSRTIQTNTTAPQQCAHSAERLEPRGWPETILSSHTTPQLESRSAAAGAVGQPPLAPPPQRSERRHRRGDLFPLQGIAVPPTSGQSRPNKAALF